MPKPPEPIGPDGEWMALAIIAAAIVVTAVVAVLLS
jgi:hypothetical protein